MGIVGGGAYAELVCAHERQVLPVPPELGLADAAAVPEVFLTAYDALVVQGGLTSGRTALVHAGASGVGTAAIQLARSIGARIVVTASTGKVEACRTLGADLVVDYTQEDFVDAVEAFTGGDGVDVVLDVIGGDYVDRNLRCARVTGRVIQVGLMGSGVAEVVGRAAAAEAPSAHRDAAPAPPAGREDRRHPALPGRGPAPVHRPQPASGDRLPLRPGRRGRGPPTHGGQRERRQAPAGRLTGAPSAGGGGRSPGWASPRRPGGAGRCAGSAAASPASGRASPTPAEWRRGPGTSPGESPSPGR